MKKYNHSNEPFQPKWISKVECVEPEFVLQDFFENFTPDEVNNKIWSLLVTALSSDNGDFQTGIERAGVLFMYERLRRVIEAAYFLKQAP